MRYVCLECGKDLSRPVALFGKEAVIEMHTRAHIKERIAEKVRELIVSNPIIDDAVVARIQDAALDSWEPVELDWRE